MTVNPTLPFAAGLGAWIVGIIHVALIVWAIVEVVRATHLHVWVRVALIVLSVLVAVVGPLLAIVAARTSRSTSPRTLGS